jgi:CDP-4-dehydro-6-deoxyglucose reductase, E3
VPPGLNVLSAALAAGIAIPYSCRAGRCASCKSRLVSGSIEYPEGTPPGITAAEIARGDVLLCQAQPRSDLVLEVRRVPVRASNAAMCELVAIEKLALGALLLRLRFLDLTLSVRPGQFADVRNHAGDAERLPVVGASSGILEVESPDDGSPLHHWLAEHAATGAQLRVAGPFDRPR